MSSKKDKLIESATKFIVKGQIDKAIKDYEQIVALDQNDLRNRQKLAELLVRVNRKTEAIDEFEKIGKYYANNAYYLKAIAVYKQIQKLDPANIQVSVILGDLNVKQGMEGNAIAEYQVALNAYEREENHEEIGKIFTALLAAYPENPNVRLKAAEYYQRIGKAEESYREFTELALIVQKKGNELAFQQVCDKIQQLFPDENGFFLDLGTAFLGRGDSAGAVKWFKKALNAELQNEHIWDQYVCALEKCGDQEQLQLAYNEMQLLFPHSLTPLLGEVELSLAAGNYEVALAQLAGGGERAESGGQADWVAETYRRLTDVMPGDERVLMGLRDHYARTDNAAELHAIKQKLANLSRAESAPVVEKTLVSEPEVELGGEATATHEMTRLAVESTRYEWEENVDELDLSSIEDSPSFEIESTSIVEPVQPEEFASSLAPAADSAFSVDWDTEGLDLGDIELVGGALDEDIAAPVAAPEVAPEVAPTSSPVAKRKQAVRLGEEVDESDTETQYNLGIAYKEMGLFDEAVKQFSIAARSPERRVDCMTLQALCLREQGNLAAAAEAFARVLSISAAPNELICARFELALLQEQKGNLADALKLYREVAATDPEYREVAQKIAELSKSQSSGYLSDQLLELVLDHDS